MRVLVAKSLRKSYAGREVVAGLDLELARGECYGLLGPNGAGKTTTLRMLLGLTHPDAGEITLLGHPVPKAAREGRIRVGVVPQVDNLDPDFTVRENLLVYARYFGLRESAIAPRIRSLLEFASLEGRAESHIRELSGGMKRRLVLARALVNDPDLIFMDEPTTGLDPQARHVVWQKLRALKRAGVTMLLTTHYMDEAAQLCDRLLIMDHGEIIARGTPAGLVTEHIGAEVIELFPRDGDGGRAAAVEALARAADHVERAGDEVYGFFRDPARARAVLPALGETTFLHRAASLEDVFLKRTGSELRE